MSLYWWSMQSSLSAPICAINASARCRASVAVVQMCDILVWQVKLFSLLPYLSGCVLRKYIFEIRVPIVRVPRIRHEFVRTNDTRGEGWKVYLSVAQRFAGVADFSSLEAVLVDTSFSIGIRVCLGVRGVRGVLASRGLLTVHSRSSPGQPRTVTESFGTDPMKYSVF